MNGWTGVGVEVTVGVEVMVFVGEGGIVTVRVSVEVNVEIAGGKVGVEVTGGSVGVEVAVELDDVGADGVVSLFLHPTPIMTTVNIMIRHINGMYALNHGSN